MSLSPRSLPWGANDERMTAAAANTEQVAQRWGLRLLDRKENPMSIDLLCNRCPRIHSASTACPPGWHDVPSRGGDSVNHRRNRAAEREARKAYRDVDRTIRRAARRRRKLERDEDAVPLWHLIVWAAFAAILWGSIFGISIVGWLWLR